MLSDRRMLGWYVGKVLSVDSETYEILPSRACIELGEGTKDSLLYRRGSLCRGKICSENLDQLPSDICSAVVAPAGTSFGTDVPFEHSKPHVDDCKLFPALVTLQDLFSFMEGAYDRSHGGDGRAWPYEQDSAVTYRYLGMSTRPTLRPILVHQYNLYNQHFLAGLDVKFGNASRPECPSGQAVDVRLS